MSKLVSSLIIAICMMITSSMAVFAGTFAEAEEGGCADQDFKTHVSGGRHCLSIVTWRSKSDFDGPVSLVLLLHGDDGPKYFDRGTNGAISSILEFEKLDAVIISIARPGFSNQNGTSSGHQSFYGMDSYTKDVLEAVLDAANRLEKYYNASTTRLIGHSGGAAVWAGAIGVFPEKVSDKIDRVILVACPCNVPKWQIANNWTVSGISVSPHEVVAHVPKHVSIHAITADNDGNTYPFLAREYVDLLRNAGVRAQFTKPESGGHGKGILLNQDTQLEFLDAIGVHLPEREFRE